MPDHEGGRQEKRQRGGDDCVCVSSEEEVRRSRRGWCDVRTLRAKLWEAERSFRDLSDTLHGHLTCAVCLNTLRDAVTLENCGHTFCESCARGVAEDPRPKCPECRRAFRSFHPAVVLRKIASSVPVVID